METLRCKFCSNKSNEGKGYRFSYSNLKKEGNQFICFPCINFMMEMMCNFKEWAKRKSDRLEVETE